MQFGSILNFYLVTGFRTGIFPVGAGFGEYSISVRIQFVLACPG